MLPVWLVVHAVLGHLAWSAAAPVGSSGVSASGPAVAGSPMYFDVTRYGAVADGKSKDTQALQKAIDAANEAGGGVVRLPPGLYLSGTIYLRNNVTLELSSGATLLGSTDLNDYPSNEPAFRSYTDTYVCQSLIAGENLRDIAIVGRGAIKGQGSDRAFAASAQDAGYRRRPYLIRLVSCRNVLVEGVTLSNSPMWAQHYLACDNLLIRGITVRSRGNANNDGLDIDCCRNVRVSACTIHSGDDAICLKSSADRPCENVVISDCVLSSACNGFKLGTESNGGFRNVTLTNCAMHEVNLAGIALLMVDGGILEGVTISNVVMRDVETPIFLRLGNRARPFKPNAPVPGVGQLRNVAISNVVATGCRRVPSSIVGLADHRIENVTLSNIDLACEGGVLLSQTPGEVPEKPDAYPEHNMFGVLPACGLYCRHVAGLVLRDVRVRCRQPDQRSAMMFDDVRDLSLSGMQVSGAAAVSGVIAMKAVNGAMVSGCVSPREAAVFARIEAGCERISVIGNDLAEAARPFEFDEPSRAQVVFESANRMRRPAAVTTPASIPVR